MSIMIFIGHYDFIFKYIVKVFVIDSVQVVFLNRHFFLILGIFFYKQGNYENKSVVYITLKRFDNIQRVSEVLRIFKCITF